MKTIFISIAAAFSCSSITLAYGAGYGHPIEQQQVALTPSQMTDQGDFIAKDC